MLSVRNWRTKRAGVAPTDSRIAISRDRVVALASSRLAMFAHAMSKTSGGKQGK
jgi:hypothetical protein